MKFGVREIVFVVLLMGIPVASWWLVFRPQNARRDQMCQQIEAKQGRLRELNRATATIGDLKKRIGKLQKAMASFRSKLPGQKEIDKVLQEVWNLAELNDLRTKSIRTLKHNKNTELLSRPGSYRAQPIAVSLEGSFLGFYSFLQALENQPRIMRVRKMALVKVKKGPPGNMQADFTMTIFFEGGNGSRS